MENLPGKRRRNSTLKVITKDDLAHCQGSRLHTVKVRGCSADRKERSYSRSERWQSTRKRMQERRASLQQQKEMVRARRTF